MSHSVSGDCRFVVYARLVLLSVIAVLGGCAHLRTTEKDELCPAILAFANASDDGAPHAVRLTTDWGGLYTEPDSAGESIVAAKGCTHDDAGPGKVLCAYLLEETSTEFPAINFRRAMRCLGFKADGMSPTDDATLPPTVSSTHLAGVHRGVVVTLAFSRATNTLPPALEIKVKGKGG